jgi:hypothetical protein
MADFETILYDEPVERVAHNQQLHGMPADPTGAEVIRSMNRPKAAS